jgi:hypothetical protein
MQIDEEILLCVGFIGAPSERGFVADGTCFFVHLTEETESFHYVVTARHLVRPIKFGQELLSLDGDVRIRVSRETKSPHIINTIRKEWIVHPDHHIDVCVLPFDIRREDPDGEFHLSVLSICGPTSILYQPTIERFHGPIAVGDEIFIPSLFPGHVGEQRNIPVVRIGNIAARPIENIRIGSPTVPAYLIETRSLGGISGAPVFLHLSPSSARSAMKSQTTQIGRNVPYALIGLVLGSHSGRYASDFVEADDNENIVTKDADFNAGISVALPIKHVLDILNSDELKGSRLAAIEEIKKQSGYRPASASAPLASDRNPTHLEDFNRLVDVAARKRPQGDQS